MQNKLAIESFHNLLSEDVNIEIARRLPTGDLLSYALSSKHNSALFTPILNTRKFLHYGTRGKYNIVKAMLEKEIELIYEQGLVIDCSGRTFKTISLFEYSLWAKDKFMWTVMLDCIPQNKKKAEIVEKLLFQYKNLKANGVTYCLNGKYFTEHHFDFENTIIKELQEHVNLISKDHVDWKEADEKWEKGVGGAQKCFPMHVVYEYCSDRPFDPILDFTQQPSSTSTQFETRITGTDKNENWFGCDSKLGIDFAIIKSMAVREVSGFVVRGVSGFVVRTNAELVAANLVAITALCEVRTKDFIKLESQLEKLLSIDNHPQPLNINASSF